MTARPSRLRRALVVAGSAAALSLLTPAVSAWSDVTVTPAQATYGGSAGVTFRVTNASRSASMTRVTIYLPEATPIGEVYPYSVPGWAPKMSMRTVSQPSQSGSRIRTTQVATAVEWNAFPGKAPKPGEVAELSLSLNPIPVADRLVFTVVEAYSDGTVVQWGAAGGTGSARPGPVIELVPPRGPRPRRRHADPDGPSRRHRRARRPIAAPLHGRPGRRPCRRFRVRVGPPASRAERVTCRIRRPRSASRHRLRCGTRCQASLSGAARNTWPSDVTPMVRPAPGCSTSTSGGAPAIGWRALPRSELRRRPPRVAAHTTSGLLGWAARSRAGIRAPGAPGLACVGAVPDPFGQRVEDVQRGAGRRE